MSARHITLARRLSVAELTATEWSLGRPLSYLRLRDERKGVYHFVGGLIERISLLPVEARARVPWHLLDPVRADLPFNNFHPDGMVELSYDRFVALDRFIDRILGAATTGAPGVPTSQRPKRSSLTPSYPFFLDVAYTSSSTKTLLGRNAGWGTYEVSLVSAGGGASGTNGRGGGGGGGALNWSDVQSEAAGVVLTITLAAAAIVDAAGGTSTVTGSILTTTLQATGGSTPTGTSGAAGGVGTGGRTNGTGGTGGTGSGSTGTGGGAGGGAGCPLGKTAGNGANYGTGTPSAAEATGMGGGGGANDPQASIQKSAGGGGVRQTGGSHSNSLTTQRLPGGDPGYMTGLVPPSLPGIGISGAISTPTGDGGMGGGGGGAGGPGWGASGTGGQGTCAVRENKANDV